MMMMMMMKALGGVGLGSCEGAAPRDATCTDIGPAATVVTQREELGQRPHRRAVLLDVHSLERAPVDLGVAKVVELALERRVLGVAEVARERRFELARVRDDDAPVVPLHEPGLLADEPHQLRQERHRRAPARRIREQRARLVVVVGGPRRERRGGGAVGGVAERGRRRRGVVGGVVLADGHDGRGVGVEVLLHGAGRRCRRRRW
mmetsp:Transcript_26721/g.106999  ORF Transcript_26721/g.106999 Transcript_26721/m.106999 type:complete len:205 (-) Transcript_26721:97-711(-)